MAATLKKHVDCTQGAGVGLRRNRMNELKSLREVCDSLGVSRRAIQNYEKAGLVAPAERNKYGYLLYGEKEQQRISQIKMYQKFGFTVKEIKGLMDASEREKREALVQKVDELRVKKHEIEYIIETAEKMIVEWK